MPLPLILAGPIARRLTSDSFAVWIATSRPTTATLSMWPGLVTAGVSGDLFDPGNAVAVGDAPSLRVGAQLHITLVVAHPPPGQQLMPGQRYSYNVVLRTDGGTQGHDLSTEGLLVDDSDGGQPALGYTPGVLPSVETCPLTLDELVLLHGSCNRIEGLGGPNLMPAIDTLIRDSLNAVPGREARPHQLWLSGDQVYSDEIAAPLSPWLTSFGRDLIGVDELLELQPLPDRQPLPDPIRVPLEQAVFPAGYRTKLLNVAAKLTTHEGASHLLGMTERVAMQLFLWSPVPWQQFQTVVNGERHWELAGPMTMYPALKAPLLDALEPPLSPHLEAKPEQVAAALVYLTEMLRFEKDEKLRHRRKEAEMEAPLVLEYAGKVGLIRRALANVPTYFVFDDHDVTDDWNLCRLWAERVLDPKNGLGRSVMRDGLVTFALFQAWGNDPDAWASLPNRQLLEAVPGLFPDPQPGVAPESRDRRNAGPQDQAVRQLDMLLGFDGTPPEVRWNYVVDGTVHRVIACDTRTRRGFVGKISPPVQLPDGERQLQVPEGPLPAGLELLVVVLSQPLLDPLLLGEIPQGLISGGVSASPMIKEATSLEGYLDLGMGPRRALGGLEFLDYEGWGARPSEVAAMLERLATYPRVLVMSGDVHFSVSMGLHYWRHNQGMVSTIGQFTSSAVQYITFPEALLPLLGQTWVNELMGRGYPYDVLVWRNPTAAPVEPAGLPSRGLRRRLMRSPVLLPTKGWPDPWPTGTTVKTPPDAAWRLRLLEDIRPESDPTRPEAIAQPPLAADFDAGDPMGTNGYPALAKRHALAVRKHANTRRIAIYNKIARLTFRHDLIPPLGPRLVARSELWSLDHFQGSADPAGPFTVHELYYDDDPATPEPTLAV